MDYTTAPESLSIKRAEREENASLCPTRDILVEMLRMIDSGVEIDLCIIAYRVAGTPAPRGKARYFQAGGVGLHDSLGLIERVKFQMNSDA